MSRTRAAATARFASRRTEAGFSLIEALVALIVLSVGMIGIAALYVQGLGAARTALYRTIAVNLVGEMADRIRANRIARAEYDAAAAANGCDPDGGILCTPAQLAAYDKQVWATLAGTQLPGGVGSVTFTPGTPPTYAISVSWHDVTGAARYEMAVQVPPL